MNSSLHTIVKLAVLGTAHVQPDIVRNKHYRHMCLEMLGWRDRRQRSLTWAGEDQTSERGPRDYLIDTSALYQHSAGAESRIAVGK